MAAETQPRVSETPLLRLEEARHRMLASVMPLATERVDLASALDRFLAEPLDAIVTLPPWDNSAMDGFAVRSADVAGANREVPVTLTVTGEVAAGYAPEVYVEAGTAVRILTGGVMPVGADSVVPVEETDAPQGASARPERVGVFRAPAPGAHIRRAGSDVHAGERLLAAGSRLTPARLALAAAVGHGTLSVHRQPRVAVLATGDELVPAGEPLGAAGIHDSNSVGLAAQATAAGARVVSLGIARDRLEDVRERLAQGIAEADVVVCSGGVSVGAHDVVKEAFESVGRLDLWRVAIQPGKPLAFGRALGAGFHSDGGGPFLFGLPGNPVSTFVTFELFVRPMLRRLLGDPAPQSRPTVRATLTGPATSATGRRTFLRVALAADPERPEHWLATLAGGQGSHVLSALAVADGLAIVPEEVEALPGGSQVDVLVLDGLPV